MDTREDQDDNRVFAARLSPRLFRRAKLMAAGLGLSNGELLERGLDALDRQIRGERSLRAAVQREEACDV